MNSTLIILLAYAVIMIAATVVFTGKGQTGDSFYVGDRNMGVLQTAMSVAATWIWAPALFTSAEKAYSNGLPGLFYFIVPNVLCLLLFIPFAKKIRREAPQGITLSGYMGDKYNSKSVRNVYHFQLSVLAILSTAVQLLAGGKVVAMLTGIPFTVCTIILAAIAVSYSLISGIRASMLTDVIQMLFMLLACIIFVPWALRLNGGLGALNLSGFTQEYASLTSGKGLDVLFSFGIPTAVGLFAGPFGDQCFWQRAFAVKKDSIGKAFVLGAVFFAVVPLSMGVLGFIAAGTGFIPTDTGLVNFELIKAILPTWVIIPFLCMLISGLLSTVDSNLCAAAALSTDGTDSHRTSRGKGMLAMIIFLAISIAIANIPGLTVTHMFLFYGTFRASTMFPTILTLQNVKLEASGVVAGIVSALVLGIPVFTYGNLLNLASFKTAGSLITVITSGIVAIAYTWYKRRKAVAAC